MNIFSKIFSSTKQQKEYDKSKARNTPATNIVRSGQSYNRYATPIQRNYDGEKKLGDLGVPTELFIDYKTLATRGWEVFLTSPFVSIVLDRYIEWVVGTGLRLQSVPDKTVLETEGVNVSEDDLADFADKAEARFRMWAGSTISDEKELQNFHKNNCEILKNMFLSGDCLVIYRIRKGIVTVDYVDGRCLSTPIEQPTNGNRVIDGVEVDKNGKHVAYYVYTKDFKTTRVKARDSFGRLRAELLTWKKGRTYDVRGISALHHVVHMLKNVDRLTDATVEASVTQSSFAYFISKDKDVLDVQNPLQKVAGADIAVDPKLTEEQHINHIKQWVMAETSKQVVDLPAGYKIEMPAYSDKTDFGVFVDKYIQFFCAALSIPPEVAMQLYTNSFSASRMATKGWEHTLKFKRSYMSTYETAYNLMLDIDVNLGKLNAPEFQMAIFDNNTYVIEAYRKCKLVGANVPHADPVKEATGHRILLGDMEVPLETAGNATEQLGTGDYDDIRAQRKREINTDDNYYLNQIEEQQNYTSDE